ncbi:MAG TPA: hypothetical protein VJ836_03545 [Candidatus Saccharimonadales bacterium]|nr:hypothetical protein [Candidatus Saccharimonadales bacterium]
MKQHRRIIAVDIDDVLSASAEGFVVFSNKQWGTRLTLDDYTEDWRCYVEYSS